MYSNPLDRLLEKILVDEDECWIYTESERRGYGAFWLDGHTIGAHVASWILHNGPIPDGMKVLHRCDKRKCVKPSCLFLGTHVDNMQDMVAKLRQARGSSVGTAKLTEEMVLLVRRLHASGEYKQVELADILDVRKTTINAIIKRRNWAWLEE